MSQTPVPTYVDTRKLFLQQGVICGSMSLERLPGFRDCLIDDEAEIQIQLKFSIDESRQRLIEGTLKASVHVRCQRCLEPLAIELADDIRLALIDNEDAIGSLDAGWDPWICADHKLELAGLVDEQLMLCMPIVNLHSSGDCPARVNYSTGTNDGPLDGERGNRENPFSVLKVLKENDATD